MSAKVTEHSTGKGDIKFMAIARALDNGRGGADYSIKLKLSAKDPCVAHLKEVSPKKVNTESNLAGKAGDGFLYINFSSAYRPTVIDKDNKTLTEEEVMQLMFFSDTDTGTAAVTYKVLDYGTRTVVKLSGIKLFDLNISSRDGSDSGSKTLEKLAAIAG